MRSKPPSFPPSPGAAKPTHALTCSRDARSQPLHGASASKPTRNSRARGAVDWLWSASRSAVGSAPKQCSSCASSHVTAQRRSPPTCSPPLSHPGSPAVVRYARGGGAQRAYAATLLQLRPAAELGEGPVPEVHAVLADTRWDMLGLTPRHMTRRRPVACSRTGTVLVLVAKWCAKKKSQLRRHCSLLVRTPAAAHTLRDSLDFLNLPPQEAPSPYYAYR